MRKKTIFKFICVGLLSAVSGIGMFVGFLVYVLPSLAALVPEPKTNLATIGCPAGTLEDMSRSRCTISTQSKAALAYAMERAGLNTYTGEMPNPVVLRQMATQVSLPDESKFKWLYAAALLGDPESQFLVGAMYSNGEGTKEDDFESLKWLNEAAHNGYRKAELRLAYMLSKGEFVEKDEKAALFWMKRPKNSQGIKQQRSTGI